MPQITQNRINGTPGKNVDDSRPPLFLKNMIGDKLTLTEKSYCWRFSAINLCTKTLQTTMSMINESTELLNFSLPLIEALPAICIYIHQNHNDSKVKHISPYGASPTACSQVVS